MRCVMLSEALVPPNGGISGDGAEKAVDRVRAYGYNFIGAVVCPATDTREEYETSGTREHVVHAG